VAHPDQVCPPAKDASVYFLGFNCYGHNAAAALVRDGEILGAVEEERLNRIKNSGQFPEAAIRHLLQRHGVAFNDIAAVGYYWNPYQEFLPAARHLLRYSPESLHLLRGASFHEEYVARLPKMLTIRRRLSATFGKVNRFVYVPHHMCHAASAFFPSPFESAAGLSVDMLGEWTSTEYWDGAGTRLTSLQKIAFPHSLGMVYAAFTEMLGFAPLSDEWKVMGLAPYGRPRYRDFFRQLIRLEDDGRFSIDVSLVSFHVRGQKQMLRPAVFETLGPPRRSEDALDERHADIAASLQERITEAVVHLAEWLHRRTGRENLCLSGGVALNCSANGAILERTGFRRLFVQPAAHDAGTALGAALFLAYAHNPAAERRELRSVYLGPEYTEDEIDRAIGEAGLEPERPTNVLDRVVQLIADGKIIGWFQGAMEFGPRALGNRSILADPRQADMKDRINRAVKFREEFRPFAASVLEEHQGDWFEHVAVSPYMTVTFSAKPGGAARVPAVIHKDGTCRIQTILRAQNPRFWELVERFRRLTGVPMVLNTSLNVKGEPIVCSPEDAIRCFLNCGLDYLVLGDRVLGKR
jgi:carbamoyltransferase